MNYEAFQQLGLSLLLGLLVGLQRERAKPTVAGIRTFALVTVFGTVCAWLGARFGEWVVAAGLVGVAALFVIGYFARLKTGDTDAGLTTEVAGILMYGIGAYLVVGSLAAAVVCGGAVAVLLQWKQPLHRFVAGMGEQDVTAIMQFVLITLVILPVLPNRTYGPFAVLNPFKLWLMVVLIVGIGLFGYVLYKGFGARAGTVLGGLLGGLISSTAVTASYARRSRDQSLPAGLATLVILVASAVLYVRVLVLVATVAPLNFTAMALPLVAMGVVCAALAAWSYRQSDHGQPADHENPAELKFALLFVVLYAVILLAASAAREWFGTRGLYVVAVLSGLTDMDAITLSTAQLVEGGRVGANAGWRAILVASLANFIFKAGLVAALGDRPLLRRLGVRFGLALLGGILILWLWPGS